MAKDWDKIKPGDSVSLTIEGKVVSVVRPWYFRINGARYQSHQFILEDKGKRIYYKLDVEI